MCRIMSLYVGIIFIFVPTQVTLAAWVDKITVLSGNWGSGSSQFAIEDSDSETIFPLVTDVSSDGNIAISDEYNGRMKVYAADGAFMWSVTPPVSDPIGWATKPVFVVKNLLVPLDLNYFYSEEGALIAQIESPDKMEFWGEINGRLYVAESEPVERWFEYSPSGMLLNTTTDKPLDLGHIEEDLFIYQGRKLRRVTVSFPSQQWVIPGPQGPCGEYGYKLDTAGNLYCFGQQSAVRYSACGKVVASFSLPEDSYETVVPAGPEGTGYDAVLRLIEGYAGVVLGDDGSIYASRATQTNYSVVRWPWQSLPDDPVGGPDVPVELRVTSNAGSIGLSWMPSLQDPGCVTGYEVGRSSVQGGPYSTLVTVTTTGIDEPYTYTDSTVQT